jgi:hypothetical protein
MCRTCHNQAERIRTKRKRELEVIRFGQQVRREDVNFTVLGKLADDLIKRFGGLDKLGQAWKDLVDRRDPRESLLAITAIVRLIERVSEAAEPRRKDLCCKSDEELAEEFMEAAVTKLAQDRDLLKAVLLAHPGLLEEVRVEIEGEALAV